MSELATLARPYADAAFKRAKETGALSTWSELLEFFAVVLQDGNVIKIVNNPKASKDQLVELMLDIGQDRIDQEGQNFIKTLVQNQRLALLPIIAQLFEKSKAEFEGYVDVEVSTAYAFSAEEQKKFAASLEKKLSKKVHMKVNVDKSLLGGVVVRAGDTVFDGSVRAQLQNLAKAL